VIRLAIALFVVQAGLHGYTASLPVALAGSGVPDPVIGVIVGIAPLVQIPAALVAGMFVDRFGGPRLFMVGASAYLAASTILLLPGVSPDASLWPYAVSRVGQGMGSAIVLPAALSMVPRLVAVGRQGFGLAIVGSAHNLTQVVLPPLSLAVLAASSLAGVAATVIGLVLAGMALVGVRPLPLRARETRAGDASSPRLRFVYRRAWTTPIVVILLYVAHWGVVIAYLPQRAHAAGADIGLFFVADALAVLLSRIPTGWLADRMPSRLLVLAGLAMTAIAIALLVLPPTTPLLVIAGILTGGGAGLVITPLLVELSRRSDDDDRGTAFSLFSAALAAALVIGSIGGAPLVAIAGFEAALAGTLLGLGLAAVAAIADGAFGARPGAA
jgi:MFS family permease